jgi:hypothetical protein
VKALKITENNFTKRSFCTGRAEESDLELRCRFGGPKTSASKKLLFIISAHLGFIFSEIENQCCPVSFDKWISDNAQWVGEAPRYESWY